MDAALLTADDARLLDDAAAMLTSIEAQLVDLAEHQQELEKRRDILKQILDGVQRLTAEARPWRP
jgi:hypothetical protein